MAGTKITSATAISLMERAPDLSSEDKRQAYRLLKGNEFYNDGTTITWIYDTDKYKDMQFSMPVSVFETWATIEDVQITDPGLITLLDSITDNMTDDRKKECYTQMRGKHTASLNGVLYYKYNSPRFGDNYFYSISIDEFNSWGRIPSNKVTDSEAITVLDNIHNYPTAAERRYYYQVLNGKQSEIIDGTMYWIYDSPTASNNPQKFALSSTVFNQWKDAQDEISETGYAGTSTGDGDSYSANSGKTAVLGATATVPGAAQSGGPTKEEQTKLQNTYEILKARRLDEGDACSITDPTNVISPCGCHYSNNDVTYLMNTEYVNELSDAYSILAEDEKYKTLSDDVQKKIADGTIDLSEEALYERYGINKQEVIQGTTKGASLNTNDKNPTGAQKAQAAFQNTILSPTEGIMSTIPSTVAGGSTVFAEGEFAQWLLENINERFRKDTKTPMIPTSIGASIAMVRGTNSSAGFGKYNYWKIPYDKSLTSLPQDSEWCAFSTPGEGIQAILQMLHSDRFKQAVSILKEKMWESTEEDKQSAAASILAIMSGDASEEHAKKALEYVTKYKMRDWDTDKTEAEGGHADTKANSSNAAKNVESKMSTAVKRIVEALAKKGIGVLVEPLGTEYCRIIKLPKGKTPCEPVYPDYVTVGDKVPEWVMSETYAKLYKEAEEKALKAAGISIKSQEEIDLENKNSQIAAFQEQQFAAWCQKNGVSYTNEQEKADAKKKYAETAASDPEHFTDGVWTPDEKTKNAYLALLRERADIEFNGDTATAAAHLKYLDSVDTATSKITEREGNWNQDEGRSLSASEVGSAGGTDFSAVDGSGTGSRTVDVNDTFEVTAYTANGNSMEGPPVTATGLSLEGKSRTDVMVIAVDKDVIPLNTDVTLSFVSSEWQKYDGVYHALDVGGGITGKHIDLFIGHNEDALADQFGRQQAKATWTKTVQGQPTGGTLPSINASVESMVSWAESTAADQSHGYSQAERTGPNYDCSSFVFYALEAGGFKAIEVNDGYAGDTDAVWPALQKIGGWKRYSWNDVANSIQRGDILHRESGHVAIAISSEKTVEASGVNSGQGSPETGDQGREIDNYNIQGREWDYVYRYQGGNS